MARGECAQGQGARARRSGRAEAMRAEQKAAEKAVNAKMSWKSKLTNRRKYFAERQAGKAAKKAAQGRANRDRLGDREHKESQHAGEFVLEGFGRLNVSYSARF